MSDARKRVSHAVQRRFPDTVHRATNPGADQGFLERGFKYAKVIKILLISHDCSENYP